VKPEDSGGASGSCEHQASTGKHHGANAWLMGAALRLQN
jgi:hypothetical protein